MAEYIEREALEKNLNERLAYLLDKNGPYDYYTDGYDEAVSTVEEFLAADVVPVVHGRWLTSSDMPDTLICSKCNCVYDMWKHDPHNYCPNCGTKMDGGDSDAVN